MNEKNKVERIFARKELRMIGAIIGDTVGSRFEWNNHRSKDFELFGEGCFATDDSIMTVAAITGGMAEAYYGVPSDIKKTAMSYLDKGLREIVVEFEKSILQRKCTKA